MYWGVVDPKVEDECRVQGGNKIMCWAGLFEGKSYTGLRRPLSIR